MNRRKFLSSSAGLLTALAGCSSSDTTETTTNSTTTSADTTEQTPTSTSTTDTTTTEPQSTTTTESQSTTTTAQAAYTVRVEFDGEWQGSISADGSSKSIEGTGPKEYAISGDPLVVAANAQKETDGNEKLTVKILQDGSVVGKQSTSAAYGLAQATSESGSSMTGDNSTTASSTADTFEFKVSYSGEWQGSLSAGGSAQSIDGTGTETISINGSPSVISGNAQKQDDSSETLTVQILKNGEVVKESSTSAEYGLAQVSYSDF